MKKSVVAVGTALTMALAGAAAPAALAQGHTPHAKAAKPKVTVSPSKPKVNDTVTAHGSGFAKNQSLVCLLSLYKKGVKLTSSAADLNTANTDLKSNSKGKVTCQQIFIKFTGNGKYSKYHCPPTKKNRKQGWTCGVAIAQAKRGTTEYAVGAFKF